MTRRGGSPIDKRTTRHPGYPIRQRNRKRGEGIFGWFKTVGGLRKTRYRSLAKTQLAAHFVGAAYTMLRIAKLLAADPVPLPGRA